jgi:hypothetical protein
MPLSPEVRAGCRSSICERRMAADVKAPQKDQGCALTATRRTCSLCRAERGLGMLSHITSVRIGMTNGLLSAKRACRILALKSGIVGRNSSRSKP